MEHLPFFDVCVANLPYQVCYELNNISIKSLIDVPVRQESFSGPFFTRQFLPSLLVFQPNTIYF